METKLIVLRHNIKQKRVRVVIQSLVIKKQLGYQTQILGIAFVFATVYFENRYIVFAVYLISWRVEEFALCFMTLQTIVALQILQTKLADVDNR